MNALKRFVWIGLATVGIALASPALADVTNEYRLSPMSVHPFFSGNYIKDAATLCPWNVRAEFSGQGWHNFERINIQRYDWLLTIGLFPGSEIGADLPLNYLDGSDGVPDVKGIGQVSAWAKYDFMHLLDENGDPDLNLTAGFEYVADSAENDGTPCGTTPGTTCRLGLDRAGYNPFGAVRFRPIEQFSVGGHFGFLFYENPLGDVINWDTNAIWSPLDWLGLRLELTGFNQVEGPSQDIISLQPGIDLVFDRLTFRIGGVKGLTDDAADWALGGGVAITFGEKCAEEEPPPPPTPAPTPAPVAEPPVKKRIVLRGVNFDFDKSNIRPVDVPILEEAVKTLTESGLPAVIAIGHTDSIGTEQYNQRLSERRADSVRAWLIAHGIPADKITAEGRGESDPVASNETADGRAQNRRVELKVVE